jgi:tetratricopeptide (TPR) repeat protein
MGQPMGEAQRFLGRADAAEEIFRTIAEHYSTSGETGFNSTISGLLALSLCDQAKFDEAEIHASKCRELSAPDDIASQAAWRMAQAQILSHRQDFDAALELADEAVAIIGATDYLDWQGEACEIRAGILLGAGRAPEAREGFDDALDRYERKGIVPWADRARARRDALAT